MYTITKFLLLFVLCMTISLVMSLGVVVGTGRWLVLNIGECEDPEQFKIKLKVNRRKLNRTHDCFYGNIDLHRDLNASFGLRIDIYKEMDGGFKFHQTHEDESMCGFLKQYAEANFRKFLMLAKVDPPNCPIKANAYELDDFVMNYGELPLLGVYGTYLADTFIMYEEEKLACVQILINYDKKNDDDENDDDDLGLI